MEAKTALTTLKSVKIFKFYIPEANYYLNLQVTKIGGR